MIELAPEIKTLIKTEIDKNLAESGTVLTKYESILSDIAFYKWAFRAVFLVALGGSIAGFFQLQDYVDGRIVERAKTLDNLVLASAEGQAQDYSSAFSNIERFISELSLRPTDRFVNRLMGTSSNRSWDLTSLSQAQRDFFFFTLVQTLPNTSDLDPTKSADFIGKSRWKDLLKDPDFQATTKRYRENVSFNFNMGTGYIRYADDTDELKVALNFFPTSNLKARGPYASNTGSNTESVYYAWYRAMTLFSVGERSEALKTLEEEVPLQYQYNFYRAYDASSLLAPFDYVLFDTLWRRLKKQDFGGELRKLLSDVFAAQVTKEIDELNDETKRSAFLKKAHDTIANIVTAVEKDDLGAIKASLALNTPDDRLRAQMKAAQSLIPKDPDSLSNYVYIYWVQLLSDRVTVAVGFHFEAKPEIGEKDVKKLPQDQVWLFQKNSSPGKTSAQDWQIHSSLFP